MVKKIVFFRDECIGCHACASCHPEFWEMTDDAKSNLLDSVEIKEDVFEREIYDDDLENSVDSGESCPVNCIHVYDGDKKLV